MNHEQYPNPRHLRRGGVSPPAVLLTRLGAYHLPLGKYHARNASISHLRSKYIIRLSLRHRRDRRLDAPRRSQASNPSVIAMLRKRNPVALKPRDFFVFVNITLLSMRLFNDLHAEDVGRSCGVRIVMVWWRRIAMESQYYVVKN